MRPVICVTSRSGKNGDNRTFGDNEDYFRYVLEAGGLPVLVFAENSEDAGQMAALCDGLLVTGGADCDPALYHEENTYSIPIDTDIEQSDLLLYAAFRKAGKPVFGICRGMQVINAAEGGSLIQDILQEKDGCHQHSQRDMVPALPRGAYAHSCTFVKGTALYDIFGEQGQVNSYHHQAVKDTAEGFVISAFSDDGLPEVMEKENVTAVQWHPERLRHDPKHMQMMKDFIALCSAQ